MKKIWILLAIAVFIVGAIIGFYEMNLSPVNKKDDTIIEVIVPSGTSGKKAAEILKENNLIKSVFIFRLYQKLHNGTVQAGTYHFNKTYNVREISDMLKNGKIYEDITWMTLVEGKNVRYIADTYSGKFNFNRDDVISTINDEEFLKELINKYWFITDDILNQDIYYSLEGYLFPDSYRVPNNYTIKDIIKMQLNTLNTKLTPLKDSISNSDFSVHELLTLASIVEQEANTESERKLVAGVFINRLNKKMSLGSDVTTYYAEKIDLGSVKDLTQAQYDKLNAYNTRNTSFIGLPVGPICNPGFESIQAVLEYTKSDYLYFYADQSGTIHFGKTESDHQSNIKRNDN